VRDVNRRNRRPDDSRIVMVLERNPREGDVDWSRVDIPLPTTEYTHGWLGSLSAETSPRNSGRCYRRGRWAASVRCILCRSLDDLLRFSSNLWRGT